MIYTIWYPSGGFGHFINAILRLKGVGFQKPSENFSFSDNGNSHSLTSNIPKFFHNPKEYPIVKHSGKEKLTVLIDNGITDESTDFFNYFPDATIIKMCYDDYSWAIIAKTMIEKAMNNSIENDLAVDKDLWKSNEDWEQREKYFLYLRDHKFRLMWKENIKTKNIFVNDLLTFDHFTSKLSEIGITLEDDAFDLWKEWSRANLNYLNPFFIASNILTDLDNDKDISHITDIWTQAVVNYFIWVKYKFEIPAWNYRNWFTSTKDIKKMLESYGVKI